MGKYRGTKSYTFHHIRGSFHENSTSKMTRFLNTNKFLCGTKRSSLEHHFVASSSQRDFREANKSFNVTSLSNDHRLDITSAPLRSGKYSTGSRNKAKKRFLDLLKYTKHCMGIKYLQIVKVAN